MANLAPDSKQQKLQASGWQIPFKCYQITVQCFPIITPEFRRILRRLSQNVPGHRLLTPLVETPYTFKKLFFLVWLHAKFLSFDFNECSNSYVSMQQVLQTYGERRVNKPFQFSHVKHSALSNFELVQTSDKPQQLWVTSVAKQRSVGLRQLPILSRLLWPSLH